MRPRAELALCLLALGCAASEPTPAEDLTAESSSPRGGEHSEATAEEPAPPNGGAPVYAPLGGPLLKGVSVLPPTRVGVVKLGPSTPQLLDAQGHPESLAEDFEVLPSGAILLLRGDGTLQRRPDVEAPFLTESPPDGIRAFARRLNGESVLVSGRELGVREAGRFAALLRLPSPRFHVVTDGAEAIYLFDDAALYVVKRGRYAKVFEAHRGAEIVSACAADGRVFVGVVGGILELDLAGGEATVVLSSPSLRLRWLAFDSRQKQLYASTTTEVFAILDGVALPLLTGSGGPLRFVGGGKTRGLYVLDRERGLLLCLSGLEWLGA